MAQNDIDALHRRSFFGWEVRLEVVPWPEEHRVSPLWQMVTVLTKATYRYGNIQEKNAPTREVTET